MALLEIAKLGHPILRQQAQAVKREEIDAAALQGLIDDMIETLREAGGAGLAAPQVFVSKRLVIVEVRQNARYPEAPEIPLTVLLNPVIEPLGDGPHETEEGWEGCLSIDNLRAKVPRARRVRARFLDRKGAEREMEVEGFFARALQHECDHLDGILFVDRVRDTRTFSHLREWERYHLGKEPEEPPGGRIPPRGASRKP